MTAEIVNLRRVRKRAERQRDEASADANRVRHGLTKAERDSARREVETREHRLDLKRREKSAATISDAE